MNDEPIEDPESRKPASQLLYGKSVSASSVENNAGLDRTSLTPSKPPSDNIPYVLNNNRLNPISNDIVPTDIATGAANIPSPSVSSDNIYANSRDNVRSSLPPLKRAPEEKPKPNGKKYLAPIIIIISALTITLAVLIILICNDPSVKTFTADSSVQSANTASTISISSSVTNTVMLYALLIIAGTSIISLAITIILAYRGETNSFSSGLKKMLIFMLLLTIALAAFSTLSGNQNNLSVLSLIPLAIACLVYFTAYFVLKRTVWFILHKTNIRSKIVFAVIYSLIYFVIAATNLKFRL